MPEFIRNKCPICQHEKFTKIGKPDFGTVDINKPKETNIVKCKKCKTIYVNPIPIWTKEDFCKLYNDVDEYFPQSEKWVNKRKHHIVRKRFDLLSRYLKITNHNMLEVGAGIQAFMARYLSRKGWIVEIQEPSETFAMELKRCYPQFNIISSDFLEMNEDKKFSLVYIDSVLEHVANPGDYLKKCAGLLEPGGILYTISPHEHSFRNLIKTFRNKRKGKPVGYLCPYTVSFHLIGFSKKGMKMLADKANLELVKCIRRDDYDWFHTLINKKTIFKYPEALFWYLIDWIGWGTNQEFILRKK